MLATEEKNLNGSKTFFLAGCFDKQVYFALTTHIFSARQHLSFTPNREQKHGCD